MGPVTLSTLSAEEQLADEVAQFYADPLGFVLFAYPWSEPGPLKDYAGPDGWQRDYLRELGEEVRKRGFDGVHPVAPIRDATASGHGIGKTTLVAWLIDWIMSTRPDCRGTVTANSVPQLETKTWPAVEHWSKLCITREWFEFAGMTMRQRQNPKGWFCRAQTCRPENADSFQGQHAADSTSFYIFDEASNIDDKIWAAADPGGLTDGEPMFFAFGNPTRRDGRFYRVCFREEGSRWRRRSIDSRACSMTNKAEIEELLKEYGENSDTFRVRVRGLPPSAGDLQFIDSERVYEAQKRAAASLPDDPLICGVDVARGGGDFNVVRYRQGMDARSVPPLRIPGELTRDSTLLVSKLAEILSNKAPERRVAHMFVDSALGGPVVNRLHQLGFKQVSEVNFGNASPDRHQANMRAYMWQKMKDWLLNGAIDKSAILEQDLTGPGFRHNLRDELVIESKESMAKRGLASTDEGDALALTFAQHVAPAKSATPRRPQRPVSEWS